MSKSLNAVQTVMRLMKLFSLIVLILLFVGMILVVLSAELLLTCASSLIQLTGSACVWLLLYLYLKQEVRTGTPFTLEGARQLQQTALISLGIAILLPTVSLVIYVTTGITPGASLELPVSLVSILGLLFLSVIFRYGAEIKAKSTQPVDM